MCFLFYCFIWCKVLTVFNFIFNQWQENKDTWWGESWQDSDEAGLCQLLQQTACELSLLLTSKQFVLWQDSREEPFKKNAVTTKKGKALEESLLSISHVRLLSISHVHFMCFFYYCGKFCISCCWIPTGWRTQKISWTMSRASCA
jgi:hypothetical protein